jgi:receptor protein-tyrosine kinase
MAESRRADDSIPFALVEKGIDPHLLVFHEPAGVAAEQFRGLRNAIETLNPEGAPRVIVVSSALNGEGKSVTAANLAAALAERRQTRVVLVDGDLRSPAVEKLFGLPPAPGLAELLRDQESLENVIRPTVVRGVSILGAGREPPESPAELLASGRHRPIFNALKESFQYILVDTPPTLVFTDASLLGSEADGILLVVRLERTPRARVEQAIALLEKLGGHVLGTFLTGARFVPQHRGAYAYPG